MTGVITLLDQPRTLDALGRATDALIYFYYKGTTVLAPIYNDADLTDPATNPVELAAGEIFPDIFLDETIDYRRRILYGDGTVHDVDPLPVVGSGSDWISVKNFGATGDGVTDDTVALQTAVDTIIAGGGGTLFFPTGTYKISDTLVVERNTDNVGVIFQGSGQNTIIKQTGSGKDGVLWTQTRFLFNSGMRDMKVTCDVTAGHCLNIGYGISNCFFRNVNFTQSNPAKGVIYGDFTGGGGNRGGIYGTEFSGGIWNLAPTSTVPGVKILANGQVFNENVFRNIVLYYATTVAFFDISTVTGLTGYWLENNYFCNLYFELCPGGLIKFDSANKWKFDGIRAWDTGGTYTNHLIEMAAGLAGTESKGNEISNFSRLGGSMDTGKYDIKVTAGQDTVYTSVGMETSTGPKFDFGSKRATVIGRIVGTLDNASLVTFFGGSSGSIKFPGSSVPLSTYDEGTWSATLTAGGTNPTTPVTGTGSWTRVGRKVLVSLNLGSFDNTGATGAVGISGLPYTVNASYPPVGAVHMIGMGSLGAIAKASGTSITLYRQTSGTAIAHTDGTAGPGKTITLSMEYIV